MVMLQSPALALMMVAVMMVAGADVCDCVVMPPLPGPRGRRPRRSGLTGS
jgi:hypothetical protein